MVITDAFQDVVVADTTWFCAIGNRIATSKKPIIMSTTTVSEIPLRVWLLVASADAMIDSIQSCAVAIDWLMCCLTVDMARVAKVLLEL